MGLPEGRTDNPLSFRDRGRKTAPPFLRGILSTNVAPQRGMKLSEIHVAPTSQSSSKSMSVLSRGRPVSSQPIML